MFASSAGGFCDKTKDALEPAVSYLQVTIKIKEHQQKCPGSVGNTHTLLQVTLIKSCLIWQVEMLHSSNTHRHIEGVSRQICRDKYLILYNRKEMNCYSLSGCLN